MAVIGIDMGGTSVRCAIVLRDGSLAGFARTPGGNFRSSGPEVATNIRRAADEALRAAGLTSDAVAAVAVGSAGAGAAGAEQVQNLLREALGPLHLPLPQVLEDLAIAFRSASPHADGVLLLAGTGAMAARYEGWRQAARSDGMGWLLGDTGSGVWIGRRVLRAAAAHLDRRGPDTALTAAVLDALGLPSTGDPRQALVAAATPQPPASWARFAPLALRLDGQDQVADALLDEAASRLTESARAVGAHDQVVFAGGLLEGGGLRRRLEQSFEGPYAGFPVVGACLVAADQAGIAVDAAALTAQLASPATPARSG
jgi:N-acetylglucosamine kinase-like BadF-type ATPase